MTQRPPLPALTLSALLAACGSGGTPTPPVTPSPMPAAELVKLRLGLGGGGMAAQGLPSGPGFAPHLMHLKVRVLDTAGRALTFRGGAHAPAGDGEGFLTLNAANAYGTDVLLPRGSYQFETIGKDGESAAASAGMLLAYSKTGAVAVEQGTGAVKLAVHAVMNPAGASFYTALPTSVVYSGDTLDLRLQVKTHAVGGSAWNVPTTDYSVGAYTVTGGTLDAGSASKLGASLTATGTAAQPRVDLSVPLTVWMQDGEAETASQRTVNVTFTHAVNANALSADVHAPTATLLPVSAVIGAQATVAGTASDAGGRVEAARLYDGTRLVASTVTSEGVSTLEFAAGGTAWSAPWTPGALGARTLTLIVNDAAGNETRAERAVTVGAATLPTPVAPGADFLSGPRYTLNPGESRQFRTLVGSLAGVASVSQYVADATYAEGLFDCAIPRFSVSALDAQTLAPVALPAGFGGCFVGVEGDAASGPQAPGLRDLIFTVTNTSPGTIAVIPSVTKL